MSYPMIQVDDPILGLHEREMFASEYEAQLVWYKDYIKKHEGSSSRREQEYVDYLKRWFGDGRCDGLLNFKTRHALHQLPMPYNIYFN